MAMTSRFSPLAILAPIFVLLDATGSLAGDVTIEKTNRQSGVIENSCAPWDGHAISISLASGIRASIYISFAGLESKIPNASFPADGRLEPGHGEILLCQGSKAEAGLPCQSVSGAIIIDQIDEEEATGKISIQNQGTELRWVLFQVKRTHKQIFCS